MKMGISTAARSFERPEMDSAARHAQRAFRRYLAQDANGLLHACPSLPERHPKSRKFRFEPTSANAQAETVARDLCAVRQARAVSADDATAAHNAGVNLQLFVRSRIAPIVSHKS